MKRILIILCISALGLPLDIVTSDSKNAWRFDKDKSLQYPNRNIELLTVSSQILNEVKKSHKPAGTKDAYTKKIQKDIVHLKKIKVHLKKLETSTEKHENSSHQEIQKYNQDKKALIQSAIIDIDSLIEIQKKLVVLEKVQPLDREKQKLAHAKNKAKLFKQLETKIQSLISKELQLIELAKKYPEELKEAEIIYNDTESLKGPEIVDRETFSVHHAQYQDHLRKGVTEYNDDLHSRIKNYHWSNT